jgi:lipopolysaccharide transport system permease protein
VSATFAQATRRSHLSRLWTSRELLLLLAWREIRVRYKQSIMGLGWAVLMPAVIVGAGLIVRVGAAHVSGGSLASSDIASVMVRAVPWAFFVGAIRFGTNSLVSNPSLVTKIAFPKEVFPISAVLSSAFDFVVATGAMLVALLAIGWRPTLDALWALPLLAVLATFTTGLALMLSALNLFYRDVKYIVEVLLTYAIFVTPVLFPVSFAGPWEPVLLLNPLAPIFESLSAAVVDHRAPDWPWVAYSTAASMLVLLVGYAWFKRLESLFAERI